MSGTQARTGETIVRVGQRDEAGTACRHCGASYYQCSVDVMREVRDPKANDGCCDECRDASGHEVRHLPTFDERLRVQVEVELARGDPMNDVVNHVTQELMAIATQVKAGTVHEDHDGWEWLYPDRILRCSCGAALVDPR